MPRSGTKLFRNLLNNHSAIFIPEIETLFIPRLIQRYGSKQLNLASIKDIIKGLKESLFFFYYNKNNDFNFDSLEVENITVLELIDRFFNELALGEGENAKIKGDKSPNYIHDIDLLLEFYSNAKFIHIVRDPRDYALSVNKAWKKNIERAIFKWVHGIKKLQRCKETHPNKILEIKYEDLIENPKEILKKCTEFLGLEYEEEMQNLKKPAEKLGDARTKLVDKKNKQKYLDKMSPNKIRLIENYTIEYLKKYNYPYTTNALYNKPINHDKEIILKLVDGFNLVRYNIKEHGVKNGFRKITKANKH